MIIYLSSPVCNTTQQMRLHRDRLLAASDWAMASDAPTDKTAWQEYRQALRDFPASWEPNEIADFPVSPAHVAEPVVVEPVLDESTDPLNTDG